MASKAGLIFHGITLLFLFAGLYDVFLNYEKNKCEMSYMWELPKYKEIPLRKNVTEIYPRYGLYLYGEGHYYDFVSNLQLSGIPVLYIPGNGGSKKQARSIASFLLRKAEDVNWDPHFNVFTVDLNEELVAFYGATLNDQVGFVLECIKAIFKLYDNSDFKGVKPKSLILVGHSMGGAVARGVLASPGFDMKMISTVVTLATPHVHPVLSMDSHISSFYHSVNTFWRNNCDKLKDITFVSVSGGDRDFQVHGAVTKLSSCDNNTVSTSSTAIPRAWASADHQCAVWCKQVVLATTRSFFDMVDSSTGQISDDPSVRMKAIRYHFLHNPGFSSFSETEKNKFKPVSSHAFQTITEPTWSLASQRDLNTSTYFVFSAEDMQSLGKTLFVARTTIGKNRWILGCSDSNFKTAKDLSSRGYRTPKYKVIQLDIDELLEQDISYILINVPKWSSKTEDFEVNFLSIEEYSINATVPSIFSNIWTLNRGYDLNQTVGAKSLQFYYRFNLVGLHSIFHAYRIAFIPQTKDSKTTPLLQLQLPGESSYTYSENGEKTVKLRGTNGDNVPVLHAYTDGITEFAANIKVQFIELLGQIVRFNGVSIPTMIMMHIMLAYSYQLKIMVADGSCLSVWEAHGISAKPYKIQPFINLVKALYAREVFSSVWNATGLATPDAVLIDNEYKIWFALMPFVTFLFAQEIFSMLLIIQNVMISFISRIFKRFFSSSYETNSSFLWMTFHTVILALLASIAGGLVLLYISTVSFLSLCSMKSYLCKKENTKSKMQEDGTNTQVNGDQRKQKAEDQVDKENQDSEKESEECKVATEFELRLMEHQMWLFLTAISFPTIVAFWKGYNSTSSDPTLPFAMFGSFLFLLHRQQSAYLKPTVVRRLTCKLLYPLTILTSIICLHSLHRIPYFILTFLSFHVAAQYFG